MKTKIEVSNISQDAMDYLQALEFEITRRNFLIRRLLEENPKVDTDTFCKYEEESEEIALTQQFAKQDFERVYILPAVPENYFLIGWNTDYLNYRVVAEVYSGEKE